MSLNNYAALAQLVEQLICNQWVGSSNLSSGTTLSPYSALIFLKSYEETLLNYIKNCILCKVS